MYVEQPVAQTGQDHSIIRYGEEFPNENEKYDKGKKEEDEFDDSGDDNPDKVLIPNFNNSFAEYGQFVDLVSLDRANPQFDKIMKKKEDKK